MENGRGPKIRNVEKEGKVKEVLERGLFGQW
jgi:hypothetical protein